MGSPCKREDKIIFVFLIYFPGGLRGLRGNAGDAGYRFQTEDQVFIHQGQGLSFQQDERKEVSEGPQAEADEVALLQNWLIKQQLAMLITVF